MTRTQEQFQWLAAEIKELGGEAMLWNSDLADPGHNVPLAEQFGAQGNAEYNDILKESRMPDIRRFKCRKRPIVFAG